MPRTYRARITAKQGQEIVELYKNGESSKDIQSSYNISTGTLYRILKLNNVPKRLEQKPRVTRTKAADLIPAISIGRLHEGTEETVRQQNMMYRASQGKFHFRIGFYVRKTITADNAEHAITQAKGYDGFQELTYLRKEGSTE